MSGLKFPFTEKTLTIAGQKLVFKELSVAENDACVDAARKPDGEFDGRVHLRMMIAKSSVSPKITVDDLITLPNHVYLAIAEFVNDLNSIDDALEEPEEGEKAEEGGGNA